MHKEDVLNWYGNAWIEDTSYFIRLKEPPKTTICVNNRTVQGATLPKPCTSMLKHTVSGMTSYIQRSINKGNFLDDYTPKILPKEKNIA